MSKRFMWVSLVSILGVLLPAGPALASSEASIGGNEIVPSQAIIRVDAEVANPAEALDELGYRVINELGPSDQNTFVVSLDPFASTSSQINRLAANADLAYAEPNYIVRVAATSNDGLFTDGSMWGMAGASTTPPNQFGSNAAAAWGAGYTGSQNVYVAVLDSGIDFEHPDLAANVWVNTGETAGNGIDDDGNGFVDDVHGYDFVNNDASVFDIDEHFHGTHVAGTIGAVGGNGAGVAGVAWNVKLISAKMIQDTGTANIADAIDAIDYVTMLRTKKGLDIIAMNASWGGEGYSSALEEAIQRGGDAGIVFVAAPGNGDDAGTGRNLDSASSYPAEMDCTTDARDWDCIVSVAAITSSGAIAGFSDYSATGVDIGAPGVDIMSTYTVPGATPSREYRYLSGTSMAAPHVTGALALCVSSYRGTSAKLAVEKLYSTSVATASLSGKVATDGRLDAGALVSSCVADNAAFSGNHSDVYASAIYTNQIRLDWTDSVIGDYEQEIQVASGPTGCSGTFSHFAFIGPGITSYPITGLTESEFYCFKIRSNNALSVNTFVKSNVSITWTSNLPFVYGKVYLDDGVTTVANAPVKWVAAGQYLSISTSGAVVRTDAAGNYVLQVSNGTAGVLSVNMPISSSKQSLMTSPPIPWGLVASGGLTVEADTVVDITLPEQDLVTFFVTDGGSPVQGVKLGWEGLAKFCSVGTYLAFAGATDSTCKAWPFGTSSSSVLTDAYGKATLAFPAGSYFSESNRSYSMSAADLSNPGKVASLLFTPNGDELVAMPLPALTTISGAVVLDDGATTVAGATVHWLAKGQYESTSHAFTVNTTTDGSGNYSLPVSDGVEGKLYVSTSRAASAAAETTPRLPWGLTAGGYLTASGATTTNIVMPKQNIANLNVTEYESADVVSGAKLQYSGLAEWCSAGSYTAFVGATSSSCMSWPTGFPNSQVLTNVSGDVSIALLDQDYFSASRNTTFSVTDPTRASRVSQVALSLSSDTSVAVEMPGPVTISGTVFLADGVTPVAGAPVKWVADGQYSSSGYASASATTDADGNYSLLVSKGTPGELYVETTRSAATGTITSPQLAWGLHAGGSLTADENFSVNLTMPEQNVVTITAREMASSGSGEVIPNAQIKYQGLARYCDAGSYTAFPGATASSCQFWPAGFSSSSPKTSASGVAAIPVLDGQYFSSNSYIFSVVHPMDVARIKTTTVTPTQDMAVAIEMPGTPSQPEQPSAVAGDGTVTLTWTEPWNGGAFIDYYQIWVGLDPDGPFELVTNGDCAGDVNPALRTCTVEGLTPGVTYYFAIIAKNVVGYSDLSISVSSVPTAALQNQTLTPTPTLSGTMTVDQTVTATAGTWDSGVALSYQWRRDGEAIAGANSSTYQIVAADVGAVLTISVTGTKASHNPVTKTSTASAAISSGALSTTPAPTITGTLTEGETLTATAGSWDSGVTLAYQWLRAGSPIASATAATYDLVAADVGAAISVRVTGSLAGYTSVSKTSSATAAIAEQAVAPVSLSSQSLHPTPTVAGEVFVGETLTATVGTWDAASTLSYRWLRNDVPISGETLPEYVLTEADFGSVISFEVTATRTGYVTLGEVSAGVGPITSAVSAQAEAPSFVLTPTPTVSGSTVAGSTLTATVGTWDDGAILSYQWYADSLPIFGANLLTYVSTLGDIGKKLSLVVTGSITGLESITKQSTQTAVVTAAVQAQVGGGGGGGAAPAPVVAIPALAKPLPAGAKFALLDADGNPVAATAKVEDSGKKLVLSGSGWSVDMASSSGFKVTEDGQAELTAGSSVELGATGYEPDSTVYFYMVPKSYLQLASFRFLGFAISSEPVELGSTKVTQGGTFSYTAKPSVAAGEYVLQIAGYNQNGEVTNLAISTTVIGVSVTDGDLASWTKNLNDGSVKIYAKNIVGEGKIQFMVNGKEVAWVRANDETDAKLREANGFYYLVRTVRLVPGQKNALEIYLDGERIWRAAYGY